MERNEESEAEEKQIRLQGLLATFLSNALYTARQGGFTPWVRVRRLLFGFGDWCQVT